MVIRSRPQFVCQSLQTSGGINGEQVKMLKRPTAAATTTTTKTTNEFLVKLLNQSTDNVSRLKMGTLASSWILKRTGNINVL